MIRGQIPDEHHVVRYVKPTLVEDEAVDGSAFVLRNGETALSVNWLEAFGGDDQKHQLSEVRRLFRLQLARNGRFAKLNVGETKRHVLESAEETGAAAGIGIAAAPLDPIDEFEADPSHAEVTGLPPRDGDEALFIGDLIAECVMYPLYPAKID